MRSFLAILFATMAMAQTPVAFDVTTVKPRTDQDTSSRTNLGDNGLLASNTTLQRMVMTAYGVTELQLVDVPKWVSLDRWDIQGKSLELPGTPSPEQVLPLLRKLLEDRFALRVHRESRQMPVYKLTVDRGGAKMTRSTPSEPAGANGNSGAAGVTLEARGTNMDDFAKMLTRRVGRTVVNQTGLNGPFDFKLAWVPEMAEGAPAGPSVFTAIREQLGLRLEAGRDAVDVLVVDSATLPEVN